VKYRPLRERFDEKYKVDPITDCWLWTACVSSNGYGLVKVGRRMIRAHRVSWELHCGDIPMGLYVLHHCDTPPCVNPTHLFLGTMADNNRDRDEKGRNGKAVLSENDVIEIRRARDRGQIARQIAPRYGICRRAVQNVIARRSWKHIPEERAVQLELGL
jgi:hypothetical protein